jgi:hypothetical protein
VHAWYEACGFRRRYSYLHVYVGAGEVTLATPGLKPVSAFAHYTGDHRDELRRRFGRVHDDVLFERAL